MRLHRCSSMHAHPLRMREKLQQVCSRRLTSRRCSWQCCRAAVLMLHLLLPKLRCDQTTSCSSFCRPGCIRGRIEYRSKPRGIAGSRVLPDRSYVSCHYTTVPLTQLFACACTDVLTDQCCFVLSVCDVHSWYYPLLHVFY